jgi:hypothetical protein
MANKRLWTEQLKEFVTGGLIPEMPPAYFVQNKKAVPNGTAFTYQMVRHRGLEPRTR